MTWQNEAEAREQIKRLVADYYHQFQRGDIVIRGVERYRFGEVKDGMCVLISDNNKFSVNNKTYVQIEHGLDIRLYSGTSFKLIKASIAAKEHTLSSWPYPRIMERSKPKSLAGPAGTISMSALLKSSSVILYLS